MDELIARIEAATEGSRMLNHEIALKVGWVRLLPSQVMRKSGGWIHPRDTKIPSKFNYPEDLDSTRGTTIYSEVPDYSTSIDAALTLVPDSHAIDLARCPEMGCAVRVYEGPVIANSAGKPTSLGATPALALCAAALKARKEML